jgi:Flp pilus assembly protein TadB
MSLRDLLIFGGLLLALVVAIVLILRRGRRRRRREEPEQSAALAGSTPRARAAKARQAVLRMRNQTRWVPAPKLISEVLARGDTLELLEQARLSRDVSLADVARIKVFLALMFAVIGAILGLALQSPLFALLLLVGGVALGYLAPDSTVRGAAQTRQALLSRALPLSMDVIGMVVERSSIDNGLAYYCEFFPDEVLAEEIKLVLERVRLKERIDVAMGEMLRRNHNDDLSFLVAAVGQATQLGGRDLRGMLSSRAQELRIKREQEIKGRSLRVPVLMTFPTMLNVLALLIALGSLAALQLFGGPKG